MLIDQHMSLKDKSLSKKIRAIANDKEEGETGSGKMIDEDDEYGEDNEEEKEIEENSEKEAKHWRDEEEAETVQPKKQLDDEQNS